MRVAALYIYPVKGCRAVSLETALLDSSGLEHDRRFAFVTNDGRALTQRDQPLLATIEPRVGDGALQLRLSDLGELAVPFERFGQSVSVDVWGKAIAARAAPGSAIVADYLGMEVRLVMLEAKARRSFADAKPVLVTSTPMLEKLNATLERPVGMERFRPNVVLDEDTPWRELRGREAMLEYAEPCARCEVTTIDQASGRRRGPQPLHTLGERFAGNFGAYCRVVRRGALAVGEVLVAG